MDLRALLWDVDGTLAETEHDGHLVAFNAAFEALGVPWRWSDERYAELLRIAGGLERLEFDAATQPGAPPDAAVRLELVRRIHRRKNELYARRVQEGRVALRPGVRDLMHDCARDGVRMAIVTTTSLGNVAALLCANLGEDWRAGFDAVVTAEDAPRKKPDPQAYRLALQRLNVAAGDCVAIEDSPAGVQSAAALGIAVVRVRSRYFSDDEPAGVLAVGPGLDTTDRWIPAAAVARGRIDLAQIREWHRAGAGPTAGSPAPGER